MFQKNKFASLPVLGEGRFPILDWQEKCDGTIVLVVCGEGNLWFRLPENNRMLDVKDIQGREILIKDKIAVIC